MKTYNVTLYPATTEVMTVRVQAENEEEAMELAQENPNGDMREVYNTPRPDLWIAQSAEEVKEEE